jgi:ABC-type nitrate/sulfonate/bicarbonate transport system substrate-binding protein
MAARKQGAPSITRRRLVVGAAAGAALAASGAPAIGQGLKKIKMTLPWLPQGSQLWTFVAREKGFWKKRGLDVEIVRGYGSGAAIQTLAQGQTDVGIIAVPTIILSQAQGIATRSFGVVGDATMGILTLDESPIKKLKDLEGRKLGSTPTSVDAACVEAFLQRTGVDVSKVSRVALQGNVLDSSLLNKQVDAISGLGTSNMPAMLAQGIKLRFFPMSDVGLRTYQVAFTTSADFAKANPSVVEAWVDGLAEGIKYYMLNFEESVDIFVNAVPEVRMSSTGKQHSRYGGGLFLATLISPETREHGIGWGDVKALNEQTDLMIKFVAPANSKRPEVGAMFTNDFAGRVKLSSAELERARKNSEEFAGYLNLRV